MNVEPLNSDLYNEALSLGITEIILSFSGGSDEGYLDISMSPYDCDNKTHRDFSDKVEAWAWKKYEYSGAGDGDNYGDDIIYNLVEKRVYLKEWHMARVDADLGSIPLEIDDELFVFVPN